MPGSAAESAGRRGGRARGGGVRLLNLCAMARPHLTLAALATAAVPGLEVRAGARTPRKSHGGLRRRAAAHAPTDAHPRAAGAPLAAAESEQSADLVALRALTPGIRSRLPFDMPEFVGQAPIDGTRAVVTTFVPGAVRIGRRTHRARRHSRPRSALAIAAVHALPTRIHRRRGPAPRRPPTSRTRPSSTDRPRRRHRSPARRAARRWEEATDDASLWRFRPTVVNGALAADSLLVDGDAVTRC